jgi:hypothetical protein
MNARFTLGSFSGLYPVVTLGAAALVLGVACGGGKPADAPAGATPATAAGGPSAASDDPTKGSGPSTTTTTPSTLPDGGELQGAKLQSSSKTTLETKGEGGPKPPAGGSQEPGRRREDIQTIIMSRRDEARKCYDDGLKAHPGIEGDLVVAWKIDPKGNPTDVAVDESKSQILEPSVGKCVVEIIKKIKFAESGKGFETRTSYPFNFRPRGPQPGQSNQNANPPKK